MSSPKKLTSSASFSPSIRISLRLKLHQAQAKNFCRVLDIRVTQVVEADRTQTVFLQQLRELLGNVVGADDVPNLVHTQIAEIIPVVAFTAQTAVGVLLAFQHQQAVTYGRHKGQRPQAGLRFARSACTRTFLPSMDACVTMCLISNVLASKSMASHFRPSTSLRRRP